MLKWKVKAFCAILIIVLLIWVCIHFGVLTFNDYFPLRERVVFSWLSVSFVAFPLIMMFPFIYFVLVLFKGSVFAFNKMDGYIGCFKWMCILIIATGIVFCFSYLTMLYSKDYIKCNGVPSGWMPGLAQEYVLDHALCGH